MSAGDLDPWRATIIATELSEASAVSCAAVEALIYPAALQEAPGAVTRRVRRVLARVDADAVRLKAAKERLDRFMRAYPSPVPGPTTWVASLPAADSAACWAAIDELAHTMHGDDPTRTLQQCRADALVDLMLTNVTVATTVTLMIPVQTATVQEPDGSRERDLIVRAAGATNQHATNQHDGNQSDGDQSDGDRGHTAPAAFCLNPLANTNDFGQPTPEPNPPIEPSWAQIAALGYLIPGIGVIGGDLVASILDTLDTTITQVLLNEHTGVVIETALDTYLPNKAIRRFIHKRDGTCRFPSCRRGATRCEPDHIIACSRGGPTAPRNLASLYKHHHRVKHNSGWKLNMTRDGICTWTDPHGRQYATYPINHHELAA